MTPSRFKFCWLESDGDGLPSRGRRVDSGEAGTDRIRARRAGATNRQRRIGLSSLIDGMTKNKIIRLSVCMALLVAAVGLAIYNWLTGAGAPAGLLLLGVTLTDQQLKEFKSLMEEIKGSWSHLPDKIKEIESTVAEVEGFYRTSAREFNAFKGGHPSARLKRSPGGVVSDECARHLGALVVMAGEIQGKLSSCQNRDELLNEARTVFGMEQRASLTSSDVPLPLGYGKEVAELVWAYGQGRKYCTVVPIGNATVKLPRLKTSPAFGFIDQSASVPEKSPQVEFVDFTALKAGGIVRFPSEIEEDSIIALGNWLAKYASREMAKWEDTTLWLADGTATYKTRIGVCKKASDLGFKVQLATTKTKPSDIALADLRLLRSKVDAAALQDSAYYAHPSMESLFVSFNNNTNGTVYIVGPNGPTLDGFPVRWIGVLPVYDTIAHINQFQVTFGAQNYWNIGLRRDMDIAISRDAYFTTDEIAMRVLERFDIGLLADQAVAVLQLAAS